MFGAVVQVLAAWDWPQRPAGVVTLPSRTRPRLITGLGEQIARTGRLPYLGGLGYGGEGPAGRQHNSAQRLHALWHGIAVPDSLRAAVAELGGPLLVVDDRIETGWTMTVAAKLLREAGAPGGAPVRPGRHDLIAGLNPAHDLRDMPYQPAGIVISRRAQGRRARRPAVPCARDRARSGHHAAPLGRR